MGEHEEEYLFKFEKNNVISVYGIVLNNEDLADHTWNLFEEYLRKNYH